MKFKDYFEARCQAAAEQSYTQHISRKERNNKPLAPSNVLLSKLKGVFSITILTLEENKVIIASNSLLVTYYFLMIHY